MPNDRREQYESYLHNTQYEIRNPYFLFRIAYLNQAINETIFRRSYK